MCQTLTRANVEPAKVFFMQSSLSCHEIQSQQAPAVWLVAHISQSLSTLLNVSTLAGHTIWCLLLLLLF
jgi:hypothetical protein